MKIRRLEIERFRGIRELAWDLEGSFVCLVGPGDSTKTTILDAIELVLSPRWNVPFDDCDFYDAHTAHPIIITATVGELPDELKSDAKYGLFVRGWSQQGQLHDEPEDGDELVLSIRLQVDDSLEPSWNVINDRSEEGRPIGWRDREKLGCIRLGTYVDRHFSWGRGSILSRLTGKADSIAGILADANRAARDELADAQDEKLQRLQRVADKATRVGAEFGVAPRSGYRPHLDVQAVSIGVGGLSLHDGNIPVRRAGAGTRRLLAAAMQREVAREGGVTLIDEVEHALEPHRIRNLLRVLRSSSEDGRQGQSIVTTHAPVTLQELSADELRVVRSENGCTRLLAVPAHLQPIVLRATEAFVARKVIVCEGKAELGLLRRFDQWWSDSGHRFAFAGVAMALGEGSDSGRVAKTFANLGYRVALLGDSDEPPSPSVEVLTAAGVDVFLWAGNMALEERLAADLPWQGVLDVVRWAMSQLGESAVRNAVAERLNVSGKKLSAEPDGWVKEFDEAELRVAIGRAAKEHRRKGWFKRVDLAEEVAGIVIKHFEEVANRDLGLKISALKRWAHSSA